MNHPHDPFRDAPDPRTLHPAAPPSIAPVGANPARDEAREPARGTRRRYAAIGVAAGLLGGAAVGAMLGAPSLSSAMSGTPTLVQQDDGVDPTDPTVGTDSTDGNGTNGSRDRAGCDDDGRGPFGGRSGRLGVAAFDGKVVAGLIGVDVATLHEELRSGSSLAAIAEANGVDVQVVIDALVAEASGHLDLAVDSGRLTEDEAAEWLAEITERIGERVHAEPGEMRPGPMGPGGHDPGGHGHGGLHGDGGRVHGDPGQREDGPSEAPSDD